MGLFDLAKLSTLFLTFATTTAGKSSYPVGAGGGWGPIGEQLLVHDGSERMSKTYVIVYQWVPRQDAFSSGTSSTVTTIVHVYLPLITADRCYFAGRRVSCHVELFGIA